jgi:rhamnogalacturonyl hydrolase YesR
LALTLAAGCGTGATQGQGTSGSSTGSGSGSGAGGSSSGSVSSSASGSSGSSSGGSTSGGSSSSGSSGGSSGVGVDGGDGGNDGAADAGLRPDVVALVEKVADWQIAQLGSSTAETWVESVFYAGLMAAYRTTARTQYLDTVTSWGGANGWNLLSPQTNADNECAGQAFVEAYDVQMDSTRIAATRSALDGLVASPQQGRVLWWWCDSLFMAPAVFAKVGAATSQSSYVDAMDAMFWDTTAYLQDPSSSLFWRDSSFFGQTCPNGKKMFWSRGNGWVIAGVARLLDALPQDYASRGKYVSLFQAMASTLLGLQRADGYWSSCLTDATDFPEPETSGTAAFAFAFAWGLNRGLLAPGMYRAAADKAWSALASAVDSNGALGWVQPVGGAPGASMQTDTAPYGVGLFLLAGSEVASLR